MIDQAIVVSQGLLLVLLLHLIGHPVVSLLLRRRNLPKRLADLDSVQRLPIEIVIGGAVIYATALALTPFHGFTFLACLTITTFFTMVYVVEHVLGFASFKKPSLFSWIALIGFGLALAIRAGPISNYLLGSNQDVSWHTLITYSIIRDGGIPYSVIQPFILQVPIGSQTIFAYFSFLTTIPPEIITFNGLVIFSSIIGLAAYLFGSTLSSQKYGVYISLIMITISFYPSAITWGAGWIVLGLTIFFVAIALVIPFTSENLQMNKSFLIASILPAMVTGFLATTYTPLFVLLLPISIIAILLKRKDVLREFSKLAVIFALGIPLFALLIYRFFFVSQFYVKFIAEQSSAMTLDAASRAAAIFLPIKQLYLPNKIVATVGNWLLWDWQNGNSSWPGHFALFFLLVLGAILLIHKFRGFNAPIARYLISVFIVTILWGLNSPLGFFYTTRYGLGIMLTELDKIAPILGTILLPVIAAYALVCVDNFLSKNRKRAIQISACIILVVMSISIVIAPGAQLWINGNYAIFATASDSDYQMLKWMNTNIPLNSTVLIHPYDAGQYVPSIGGQNAVGIASTGIVFITIQYANLFAQINNTILDKTTVNLLRTQKIDYIFVGSQAIGGPRWNPDFFLRNPIYFQLVRNIELTYLFAVKIPDKDIAPRVVNNSNYIGLATQESILDLRNMAIYNLVTGEGVYVEVGLRDQSNNSLEALTHWAPASSIRVSEKSNELGADFVLSGQKYTFDVSLSSTDSQNIRFGLSAANAPQNSSVYFSYFPVNEIWQNGSDFTPTNDSTWASSSHLPVEGFQTNGGTSYQIIPTNQDAILSYTYYLTVRCESHLDAVLRTYSRWEYTGIRTKESILDLNNMGIYDLLTGQGVFIELGVKDQSGNLETLTHWNPPISISVSEKSNGLGADFVLQGQNYTFDVSLSSNDLHNIDLSFSVANAPPKSSVYLSYFPINETRQLNLNFIMYPGKTWVSPNHLPVQGIYLPTSYQIIPGNQATVFSYGNYLTVQSETHLEATLKTEPYN
jgi:hypothetical protein